MSPAIKFARKDGTIAKIPMVSWFLFGFTNKSRGKCALSSIIFKDALDDLDDEESSDEEYEETEEALPAAIEVALPAAEEGIEVALPAAIEEVALPTAIEEIEVALPAAVEGIDVALPAVTPPPANNIIHFKIKKTPRAPDPQALFLATIRNGRSGLRQTGFPVVDLVTLEASVAATSTIADEIPEADDDGCSVLTQKTANIILEDIYPKL
jgi:hypothetical protein